jgi:hypothetical protein
MNHDAVVSYLECHFLLLLVSEIATTEQKTRVLEKYREDTKEMLANVISKPYVVHDPFLEAANSAEENIIKTCCIDQGGVP